MTITAWRRLWLTAAGASGAVGMCGGALAAHGYSGNHLDFLEIAVRYQLIHALVLLAIGIWPLVGRWSMVAGTLFLAGSIFFCGSLYATALFELPSTPLVPIGGTCLILGWVALGVAPWRDRKDE